MYRLPVVIQGHQRVANRLRTEDAKKVVEKAFQQLKKQPDPKARHLDHLQTISQGVQREQFHTGGRYPASGKALFGDAYEEWSDDMACILQGTCLPGSTKYCRTKSMFGKLEQGDVMQGTLGSKVRLMSTLGLAAAPHFRGVHTLAAPSCVKPQAMPLKNAHKGDGTPVNVRMKSGLPRELWNDEIACILQGTCLPGSTRYCRTKSMFGSLELVDVMQGVPRRSYSTQPSSNGNPSPDASAQLTQRQRLKRAVKDYGSTVIVFHVCISLMSLGGFYLAVSSGLDVPALLTTIGFSSELVASRIATGTSTFLMAYGVHKLFAPARIAVTLTCTPFIVRYLRGVGILKVKPVTLGK
ncbi:uncharacterized protein LOC110988487 [Acanthaster planci]|uniref:Uncharacterized protein LOC110988487 n=1 Tax=Acanthaster planci TaxID=133434 RepID=A0A8B7ZRN3_ACAPL|nr:uncharacterized protein LOC110988487 [Acanthaster planci]XP_022107726.1 uncharacterized protein LOC110988487 [Acanthaster planci]XP_022107727.1 uncharacterized protein LOC110988487 [Acanthaster planci]XP_022107728.1 uncharacterized protein LOC110988487 [Acanthaster planci]XP_022107729.1 uncharacterized protein LOC110988487 [Acanthaster planci]